MEDQSRLKCVSTALGLVVAVLSTTDLIEAGCEAWPDTCIDEVRHISVMVLSGISVVIAMIISYFGLIEEWKRRDLVYVLDKVNISPKVQMIKDTKINDDHGKELLDLVKQCPLKLIDRFKRVNQYQTDLLNRLTDLKAAINSRDRDPFKTFAELRQEIALHEVARLVNPPDGLLKDNQLINNNAASELVPPGFSEIEVIKTLAEFIKATKKFFSPRKPFETFLELRNTLIQCNLLSWLNKTSHLLPKAVIITDAEIAELCKLVDAPVVLLRLLAFGRVMNADALHSPFADLKKLKEAITDLGDILVLIESGPSLLANGQVIDNDRAIVLLGLDVRAEVFKRLESCIARVRDGHGAPFPKFTALRDAIRPSLHLPSRFSTRSVSPDHASGTRPPNGHLHRRNSLSMNSMIGDHPHEFDSNGDVVRVHPSGSPPSRKSPTSHVFEYVVKPAVHVEGTSTVSIDAGDREDAPEAEKTLVLTNEINGTPKKLNEDKISESKSE